MELVALQRAISLRENVTQVPSSTVSYITPFVSSSRDVWLNSLWLASLSLTLATALVAGLIKQWLQYYVADVTGSAKNRACIRQYRYIGLAKWYVPAIIETLPVVMNTSLFLFFLGLIFFTQDLSRMGVIRWFLIALAGTSFAIFALSSLIPIWSPQCPYKTSLSKVYVGSLTLTHKMSLWLSSHLGIQRSSNDKAKSPLLNRLGRRVSLLVKSLWNRLVVLLCSLTT